MRYGHRSVVNDSTGDPGYSMLLPPVGAASSTARTTRQ